MSHAATMRREALICKIIDVMTHPANDGLTQKRIAQKVGISVRSLQYYLTPPVWEEIRKLRLDVMHRNLNSVHQMVFVKAVEGDVNAAKLIYQQWEKEENKRKNNEAVALPRTLSEVNTELKKLQEEIAQLEKIHAGS